LEKQKTPSASAFTKDADKGREWDGVSPGLSARILDDNPPAAARIIQTIWGGRMIVYG